MTDEIELEARAAELRRLVYGTPHGHESDAVAELVAVELELARLRATPETAAEPSEDARAAADTVDAEFAVDAAIPGRLRRRRRLALAGGALLLVGAAVAVALGRTSELIDPPRGLEVFERARGDADAGPRGFVAVLDTDAVATLRSIGRAVGHDVWVFRDDGDVCMIAQRRNWSGWGANCVSETEFGDGGIRQFIPYDEFDGRERPADLDPASAVELTWDDGSAEVEWSVVPLSNASIDDVRVWGPTSAEGGLAPMTYEEWSSTRLAERPDGS
ncbi:hypothetical protein ACFWN7_05855 [Agromyces sp. NPDC058484]|uniref:hypothetical protein n=1 Tax=Agromyces sp. NPDC058484 TaxID=3346524 RepID=UPI00364794A8